MDKQIIKTIIGEKQQEIRTVSLLQRADVFDVNANYVLTGIRRAGKSYTLYQDMQSFQALSWHHRHRGYRTHHFLWR